jgi:hypothetical protein
MNLDFMNSINLTTDSSFVNLLKIAWIKAKMDDGLVIIRHSYQIRTTNVIMKDDVKLSTSERLLTGKGCLESKSSTATHASLWYVHHKDVIYSMMSQLGITNPFPIHSAVFNDDVIYIKNIAARTLESDDTLISISYDDSYDSDTGLFDLGVLYAVDLDTYNKKVVEPPLTLELPEGYSHQDDYEDETQNAENNILDITYLRMDKRGDIGHSNMKLHYADLKDLECNYNKDTFDSITKLCSQLKSGRFLGRLVFIYGEPGTGKTFLIKSLLGEIQETFNPYVVATPLDFFRNGGYFQLLDDEDPDENLVLVFEDADSLVSEDARDQFADEFSALANATSGLIGSGRNDIFIFTFNRDVQKIDSALLRECRCLGDINIETMNAETVEKFKAQNGPDLSIKKGCSLAQAYELLINEQKICTPKTPSTMGFGE